MNKYCSMNIQYKAEIPKKGVACVENITSYIKWSPPFYKGGIS